jgi:surfactin family lipopeptide synthetase A
MVDAMPLSDAKRKLLEKYYCGISEATAAPVAAIAPRPPGEPAPVSLSQEQVLLREQLIQGDPALYNECIRLRMKGPLDVSILQRCLREIVQRHEMWRSSYVMNGGGLMQVIHPAPENVELPVVDLRGRPKAEVDEEIQRIAGEALRQPFDLMEGPLWRARMFRTADLDHSLFLCAHLSIVDGVSVYQVFPFELAALYRAYSSGQPSPLPDLTVQFGDYARWQREWLQRGEASRQVTYWRKRLAGPIPVLDWPSDRARPAHEAFSGVIQTLALRRELVEALGALCRQEGVTLFMGLLAGLVGLLHFYTQQEDIIVGTPSPSGRKRSEVQKLLGYFLNPVALRFDLAGDPTFSTLLRQAQQLTLEALSNDDVPLELLAKELGADVGRGRNPFFTVAMSLQPPMPKLDLDWSVTSMDIGSGGSPWDLYLAFINRPTETIARVQYNPDLFDAKTITSMMADYQTLLHAMTGNPSSRVSDIGISLRQERQRPTFAGKDR